VKCATKGCFDGSEYFFHTPSPVARDLFHYMNVCGHIYCGADYKISRETYNDYLLMYVTEGRLDVINEGEAYQVFPQQAILMNCHAPHVYGSISDTEFWYVHFDGGNSDKMYQYIKKNIGIICTTNNDKQILEPLKVLVSRCKYNTRISDIEVANLLYTILCNIIALKADNEGQECGGNQVVKYAVDYIDMHYASDLSLTGLAEKFNLSPWYFSRLFKQHTQQSPHDYIISTRLDKAKYILCNTDMPISEIAYTVGYSSDTGFINAFSKRIGISPRKFRVYFNTQ
jgi:AraC family transcriptional regulator